MARPDAVPRRGRVRRVLFGFALVLVVFTGALVPAIANDTVTRFLARQGVSLAQYLGLDLQVDGVTGNLYRGLEVERVRWAGAGTEVVASTVSIDWSLANLLRRHVAIERLEIAELRVQLPEAGPDEETSADTARAMPGDLGLPVTLALNSLRIDRFVLQPAGDADPILLQDLRTSLAFENERYRVSGLAVGTQWGRVSEGDLGLGAVAPHPIAATLSFEGATRDLPYGLAASIVGDLNALRLRIVGSAAQAPVVFEAGLAPLAAAPLRDARIEVRTLDLRAFGATLPRTALAVDVEVEPVAGDDAWQARVALSNTEPAAWPSGGLPLRELSARLGLEHAFDPQRRTITVNDLEARLPGARNTARVAGAIEVRAGETLSVAGVDLPTMIASLRLERIDLSQFLAGVAPTALSGGVDLSRTVFDIGLTQPEGFELPGAEALPAAAGGAIEVRLKGALEGAMLRLAQARVAIGGGELSAAGRAGLQKPHRLDLQGTVARVDLARWLPPLQEPLSRWRDGVLNGRWQVAGEVLPAAELRVGLELSDSRLAGQPLKADVRGLLALNADGGPRLLDEASVELALGPNELRASGALGRPEARLDVRARLPSPQLLDPRLVGDLRIDGNVASTFETLVADLRLRARRLVFTEQKEAWRVGDLVVDVRLPAAAGIEPDTRIAVAVDAQRIRLPGQPSASIGFKVDGSVRAHEFSATANASGQSLSLAGRGSASLGESPAWEGRLSRARLDGDVPVQLTGAADIAVSGEAASLSGLALDVAGGTVRVERLAAGWAGTPSLAARGRIVALPLVRLVESLTGEPAPQQIAGAQLDAAFDVSGTDVQTLDGTIRASVTQQPGPLQAGAVPLSGDNRLQLTIEDGRLDGDLRLELPSLGFVERLTDGALLLDGRVRFAADVKGTVIAPELDGRLSGRELTLTQAAMGWRLTDGRLAARVTGRRLELETLRFTSGGGRLQLEGNAHLLEREAAPTPAAQRLPLDGRFDLVLQDFQVPIGPGQRVTVSGASRLVTDGRDARLEGALKVDRGLIEIAGSGAPTLPDDVLIVDDDTNTARGGAARNARRTTSTAPATRDASPQDPQQGAGAIPPIDTNLAIDLGDRLRVIGNGIDARLGGELTVGGTLPENPRVSGTVRIVEGVYEAYGQKLDINRSSVRFNGPIDNPSLDIVATRPNLPVEVGVRIDGNALSPRVELFSRPAMADAEKLSWLVLGTSLDNAPGAAQSLALRQAALTLLGAKDDGIPGGGITDRLGLDYLGLGYASQSGQQEGVVDEGDATGGLPGGGAGDTSVAAQEVVSVGKTLSDRLRVSYEQGLAGLYNLLKVQYEISDRLSVRAQTGSESAVDLLYFFSFD